MYWVGIEPLSVSVGRFVAPLWVQIHERNHRVSLFDVNTKCHTEASYEGRGIQRGEHHTKARDVCVHVGRWSAVVSLSEVSTSSVCLNIASFMRVHRRFI